MLQEVKQIHYQSYYWLQSGMAMIPETDLSENGWVSSQMFSQFGL